MIPGYMIPLANHLWQSTLFAIAVWLMIQALRKNRAAVRHRLWLAASVKFLVPFSLLAGIGSYFEWNTTSATPPLRVSMIVETVGQPFSASSPSLVPTGIMPAPQASRFSAILFGVWICGVAASHFWWFICWRKVRRAVRRATPANLDAQLRVMYCPERFEPGVFGIFRPVLLLPEGITHNLSSAQLQAVLAHELSHVRRRDNLAMAIHMIVEALFWFHPLVWFIKVRLLEEQELACDEEVLRLGSEPAVYAESLLKVCEFYVESPLTCVSGVTGPDLKKRVGRIMRNQIGEDLNGWRKVTLAAASAAVFAIPVLMGVINASPIGMQASQDHTRPADTPKWEVVSIRPCGSTPEGGGQRGGEDNGFPFRFSADRMSLRCRTVRSLIESAYKTYLEDSRLPGPDGRDSVLLLDGGLEQMAPIAGGPGWINSERYTIEAKAEGITDRGIMQGPMLQMVLEDRFQLKVHWATRETARYALTVAKGGPKLKPFQEGSCTATPPWPDINALMAPPPPPPRLPAGEKYCEWGGGANGDNKDTHYVVTAEGATIDEFVKRILYDSLGTLVIDRTGLTGKFDIHLEYAMNEEHRQRYAEVTGIPVSDLWTGPNLFTALQEQLGLKLEPTRAPVEHLVIDRIERPSPN